MGLFARFVCLRCEDSAHDLARTVRDMLRARNVVETTDPAQAERLLMIAPAGPGWLMVFDHVERPSEAMDDADGLLAELSCAGTALDIIVAENALAIERRPEATLRDLELCLEPMLATQADSQAFWDRFRRPMLSP